MTELKMWFPYPISTWNYLTPPNLNPNPRGRSRKPKLTYNNFLLYWQNECSNKINLYYNKVMFCLQTKFLYTYWHFYLLLRYTHKQASCNKGKICTISKGDNIWAKLQRWIGMFLMNTGWGAFRESECKGKTMNGWERTVCLSKIKR